MLLHCYPEYKTDPQTALRIANAQRTWSGQKWKDRPIRDEELPRQFVEGSKKLPFIRDVLDVACRGLAPFDHVVYTNSDICLRSDCASIIEEALKTTNALYCYRRDFHHDFTAPIADADIEKGQDYPGSDLKAFTVQWWKSNRKKMPDMILGLEAWDPVFRTLVEETNPGKKVSIPNLIYHRKHDSYWERPENRYRLPGNLLCLNLARKFFFERGINPQKFGIP